MRPPPSVHQAAPEWARVQILLNLGRTIEAADEAKAIAQDTSWDRRTGLRCGLPVIYPAAHLPVGWMLFWWTGAFWVALVAEEVHQEFGHTMSLFGFANLVDHMPKVTVFRRFEVWEWRAVEDARRA